MTATLPGTRKHTDTPTKAPARRRNMSTIAIGLSAWLIGLIFIVPILYMLLTSLHMPAKAQTYPPSWGASLTLSNYSDLFNSTNTIKPALINSLTASIVSTLFVLALAIPAAYALSLKPVRKWTDVMFFFLSTRMLPPVAGILPIYLFTTKVINLPDNVWILVVLYTSMNLPIAVWMMRSFLAEGATGHHRGGIHRRGDHAPDHAQDRCSYRHARYRRDLADLLHLLVERAAVRQGVDQCQRPDSAGVRQHAHPDRTLLSRAALCRYRRDLATGSLRRIRCAGQARPGLSLGAVK